MSKYEINDYDIRNRKYSLEVLERNIHNLSLKLLLRTQVLTADFCVEYILSEKYSSVEETYICDGDVLRLQPHISEEELMLAKERYCQKYGVTEVGTYDA